MTTTKKFTQYLKCEFTSDEITGKAHDLAGANRERAAVEQRKKEIDSDLKSKIEAQNSVIQRLSEQITTGHEYRDVECSVSLDQPTNGQKTIIRMDTGEVVKVERMTDDDRQLALDLEAQAVQDMMKDWKPIPEERRLPEPEKIDEPEDKKEDRE